VAHPPPFILFLFFLQGWTVAGSLLLCLFLPLGPGQGVQACASFFCVRKKGRRARSEEVVAGLG
jgi:hypothetical protein